MPAWVREFGARERRSCLSASAGPAV